MARSLALPCHHPGCAALNCTKHKRKRVDNRQTAVQRGYNARWQRLRLMYLRDNPLCIDCLNEGRVTAATDVHHIKAKRDGGTNEWNNLQSLCHKHHSKRTAVGE